MKLLNTLVILATVFFTQSSFARQSDELIDVTDDITHLWCHLNEWDGDNSYIELQTTAATGGPGLSLKIRHRISMFNDEIITTDIESVLYNPEENTYEVIILDNKGHAYVYLDKLGFRNNPTGYFYVEGWYEWSMYNCSVSLK